MSINKETYNTYITYAGGTFERKCAMHLKNALLRYRLPKSSELIAVEYKPVIYVEKPDVVSLDILREDEKNLLSQSEILIVVCSEASKTSRRVYEQIEHFHRIGKGSRVLTLLVSGEPHDAFPENLTGSFLFRYIDANGNMAEELKSSEPLAADIRASNLLRNYLRLREEKLRIIAQIVGCSFDGLKQRYWHRKKQMYTIAASAVVSLGMLFCLILVKQSRDILKRRDAMQSSSDFITDQLQYYLADLPSKLGDSPETARLMNENVCTILRDLQHDMERQEWGAKSAFSDLKLEEILKVNPYDTAENTILKAGIYRMQGDMQAYLNLIQNLSVLNPNDFTGDVEAYVKDAKMFSSLLESLRIKGGLYVSKVQGNWLEYGLLEGDILFSFREDNEVHSLVYFDDLYLIYAYLSPENPVEVFYLRWDGEKYVKKSIIIDKPMSYESMRIGLYEI